MTQIDGSTNSEVPGLRVEASIRKLCEWIGANGHNRARALFADKVSPFSIALAELDECAGLVAQASARAGGRASPEHGEPTHAIHDRCRYCGAANLIFDLLEIRKRPERDKCELETAAAALHIREGFASLQKLYPMVFRSLRSSAVLKAVDGLLRDLAGTAETVELRSGKRRHDAFGCAAELLHRSGFFWKEVGELLIDGYGGDRRKAGKRAEVLARRIRQSGKEPRAELLRAPPFFEPQENGSSEAPRSNGNNVRHEA